MFKNAKVALNYKANGKTVAFSGNNEDLVVNYSFDGKSLKVTIKANKETELYNLKVIADYNYPDDVRIMPNGYQSWSLTREYKKNEYLFNEGNPSSALFIVKTGKISIQKTIVEEKKSEHLNIKKHNSKSENNYNTQVYAEATEGDLFGEMSLVEDNAVRATDAICVEPATLLVLFRHDIFNFFDKEQGLGNKILKNFIRLQGYKLKENSRELLVAKLNNEKLACYINNLQQSSSSKIKTAEEVLQDSMLGNGG